MNSLYVNKAFHYNNKSLNISMLNNLNFSKPNKKVSSNKINKYASKKIRILRQY